MDNKKVKVINPNKHRVGLRMMDGVREMVVHPESFVMLDANEIYYINNMSRIFSRKHLVIEDEEINQDLGYAEKTVANLSNDEIEKILKGNFMKMKSELEKIEEKHIIDKVVSIAKDVDDLAKGKISYISKWSGYELDQILDSENEDEE